MLREGTAAAALAGLNASDATRQAAIALSRQLAAQSLSLDLTDPLTARQLAVAAWRVYPTDLAYSALVTLVAEQQQDGILPAATAQDGVTAVAFSPNGPLLASASDNGTVRLWDTATRHPVGTPIRAGAGPGPGVAGVTFNPSGTLLATAGADGRVRLWNLTTRQLVSVPVAAGADGVISVAFSPDGELLASAASDGTVQLWDVSRFANPYAAPCTDVGSPTQQTWDQYAGSTQPFPKICT